MYNFVEAKYKKQLRKDPRDYIDEVDPNAGLEPPPSEPEPEPEQKDCYVSSKAMKTNKTD